MKTLRNLFAGVAAVMLTASCLNSEDPYQAGFYFEKPSYVLNTFFANNQVDTVSMFSYGKWYMTIDAGGDWFSVNTQSGKANTVYTFPVVFKENATGQGRGAQISFYDSDHPDEAHATVVYWQYGTRGDGSMGNAADVKAITGSDGSRFEFSYDAQHRPLQLRITKDDNLLQHLKLSYNDRDSIITIEDRSKTMTSHYDNDYQPDRLVGNGDTIGYSSQYYNYMPVSATYAFNLEHRTLLGNNAYYAFLLGGQSLTPDSLHCADSLSIARVTASAGTDIKKYKLEYSDADNRYQSVDVNQLIFGTELCDPYQLLSLFRYARQTSIVKKAVANGSANIVEVKLNANRSVSELRVSFNGKDASTSVAESVTYTFEY